MKAESLFREKRILVNRETGEIAIAELKIWRVQKSRHYEHGRRFSLFLVSGGRVILGFDNHSPKGPHLHLGSEEMKYEYENDSKLLNDFWDLVRKAGFEP